MCPLAECDLETYLARNHCRGSLTFELITKWVGCLLNTLAYVHSKEIRHKDIKPRNILIKGRKIYLTDFGSGHMFQNGGESITSGLAYGHTRAYCAPEVIENDDRNRSSDVFSLGCVLTEMVVWSSGVSISDYFDYLRDYHDENMEIVQYHRSITHVALFFEEEETQLAVGVVEMYRQVICHMIYNTPGRRRKAVDVAKAMAKLIPQLVPSTECTKCAIQVWVPDKRGTVD